MAAEFSKQSKRFLEQSIEISDKALPESWDWRKHGVVTPVKNQGHCGSCWAHATTEVIESHAALSKGGELIVLS